MGLRGHIFLTLIVCTGSEAARASYHFTQIEQVIGGVKGNVNAQAIQIRMLQPGQDLLHFARIRAWDAQGKNPVLIIQFSHDVTNGNKGDRTLITSTEFNALTDSTTQPDFTMTSVIPSSYLAAGSLTFEYTADGTILWRISWGGTAYTGPTTASMVNNPAGDFKTPFAGPLPSTNLTSLLNIKSVSDTPTSTAGDYQLTTGASVWTNNAGQQFTLVDRCPNDPTKIVPGVCGCGTPDTDRDGDGRPDCVDPCPDNPQDVTADNCTAASGETTTPAPTPARGLCGLGAAQAAALAAVMLFVVAARRRIA